MDRATKIAAIAQRLDRAKDDLETAHVDLAAGKWRGAVIRAYYTVFRVVDDAERFVARLERYLREVGAVKDDPNS